jgi:hypothetical protein
MAEQNYNLDFAQKFQQQFEFYFTGLVFTLLGLAVQTGKSTHHIWAGYFEFGGWVCLMVCGLASLHRLWMVPTVIRMQVHKGKITQELGQLNIDIENGHPPNTIIPTEDGSHLTLMQAIERHAQSKKYFEAKVKKSIAWNTYKGRICMATFLLALLCLIISRGTSLFLD